MVVRLTYLQFSPGKANDSKRIYNEVIVPTVRKQKGNLDCRLLEPMNEADDFISMTVWDNEKNASTYESSGVYKSQVDLVRPNFSKPPVLKVFHAEGVMEHV